MMHVVGFSAQAFPTYVDANGDALGELGVVEKATLKYGKTVYLGSSRRASSKLRGRTFECDAVKGVELDEVDTNGVMLWQSLGEAPARQRDS
jgi:hypothetical protein